MNMIPFVSTFEANGERIEYAVRYGTPKRRHLMIRITPNGEVEVVMPREIRVKMAADAAADAVRRRANWIMGHLRERRERPLPTALLYQSGETHLYLGQACRLDVLASRSWEGVHLAGDRLVVSCRGAAPERVKKLLDAWLRDRASQVFAERFALLTPNIPWLAATPTWGIRTMRRRWGSCSALGFITLNTRLVQLPLDCVDYVILHEIAHLQELNHGPHFYALLQTLCPNWQQARKSLRQWGERLGG